jgi:hypothetical protein
VVSGSFDCRLSLQVRIDLPPFEIVRRTGFAGAVHQRVLEHMAECLADPIG